MKTKLWLGLILPFVAVAADAHSARALERTLAGVERQVAQSHPKVKQAPAAEFAAWVAVDRPVVVFDVREEGEHRVSRIRGAIRVDPGVRSAAFLSAHVEAAKGKDVVFYCSVGVRSSRLAERVGAGLLERGARSIYNLEGGVFRWHNEGRALVNDGGATPFVHPYDSDWGRLLARGDLARTKPE